ncbi:Uncharacterised protein [Serratia ficaria]|nr:Uncharacterised protein [Serratia ficaria]
MGQQQQVGAGLFRYQQAAPQRAVRDIKGPHALRVRQPRDLVLTILRGAEVSNLQRHGAPGGNQRPRLILAGGVNGDIDKSGAQRFVARNQQCQAGAQAFDVQVAAEFHSVMNVINWQHGVDFIQEP